MISGMNSLKLLFARPICIFRRFLISTMIHCIDSRTEFVSSPAVPRSGVAGAFVATLVKFICAALLATFVSTAIAAEKELRKRPITNEEIKLEKSLELLPRTLEAPPGLKDHFIACRAKETQNVDSIIAAVKNANTDVLLYFHGGLSNQKYMVEELGPWLMKSVFGQKTVKNKLYPIFVNYDAGVWDWDIFSIEAETILESTSYRRLRAQLRERLGLSDKQGREADELGATAEAAAKLIYALDSSKSLKSFDLSSEEEQIEYFVGLLRATELPDQFRNNNKSLQNELGQMAKYFQDVDNEYSIKNSVKSLNGTSELKFGFGRRALAAPTAALRVIRILARMALQNDHGLDATIAEEVFDGLKVSDLGQLHWNKVKRHAKQCFAEGSNGRNLIDQLVDLKNQRGRLIHTWSHSAGSIPTAELINYLGLATKHASKPLLDQVQMVAPAINQEDFNRLLGNRSNTFVHLTAYALTQKSERDDELIWGLYPASLLYAVSSLGEKTFYLDKMLILDQHMQPNRKPYKYWPYRKQTGEHPLDTWRYFSGDPANNATLYLYPQKADTLHVECTRANKKCGPSHEGTKLPWLSTDLARRILVRLNVTDANQLIFLEPSK